MISIVYITNSGSTYLMAREIAKELKVAKKKVQLLKATETNAEELAKSSALIMGSPSWLTNGKEGQPHEAILELLEDMRSEKSFTNMKMALFGPGDNAYTYFCGAVDEMEKILETFNVNFIYPPLKLDEYFFHLDKNSKAVINWAKGLAKVL